MSISTHGSLKAFEAVRADLLRFLPELVAELGGDPSRFEPRAPEAADLSSLPAGLTYREAVRLLERAAAELGCPDFGMRLATLQGGSGVFGPLGLAMKNSRTFGQALDYVSQHIGAHSLAARVTLRRLPEDGLVFSGHDLLLEGAPNRCQAMEQIMLVGHLAALQLTGGAARVRRVHFRHRPVSPLSSYRRYFGCEVRFDQAEDGVFFRERDLQAPVLDPDELAYARVTAFINSEFDSRRPPLHAQVRGLILQLMSVGPCRNERVAAELKLHPRTLLRRLESEGASFQKIKDEVRRDLALYLLQQTDLDFGRISERLGYAEQSVLTRTCRRWFGASPTEVRARWAKGEGAG